jgi:hypothetical protein
MSHMKPKMTLQELNDLSNCSRLNKLKAIDYLNQSVELLQKLLDCKDDKQRIRIWKKLYNLTHSPFTPNFKLILLWSKIINDPNYKY